eukprot:1176221-Prorocentrum_minimum.AAC.1
MYTHSTAEEAECQGSGGGQKGVRRGFNGCVVQYVRGTKVQNASYQRCEEGVRRGSGVEWGGVEFFSGVERLDKGLMSAPASTKWGETRILQWQSGLIKQLNN